MIYCVEDDMSIRELVVYTLQNTGFTARGCKDGNSMFAAFESEYPELILLDIMLPGENGIELLKKLRSSAATKEIPVILLTAKGTEFDKVIGLDNGADDYIVKPFGMMELISRIKAVLRRTQSQRDVHYSCGDLRVDIASHKVFAAGKEVELTLKEFKMLCMLLENRGKVLTRDVLLEKLWGYDFDGETRTVDVHIRSLRVKLGDSANVIETIRGVGYRIGEKQ